MQNLEKETEKVQVVKQVEDGEDAIQTAVSRVKDEERRKSVQRAKRVREIKAAKAKMESEVNNDVPSPGLTKRDKLRIIMAMSHGKPC